MDINELLSARYKTKHNETSQLAKLVQMAKTMENVIDLTLGDPDISTPDEIIKAAFDDVSRGHTHYTKLSGYDELIEGIQAYYLSKYNARYSENEIVCTAGGCFALYAVFHALLNPGDEVIIPSPYFIPYANQVRLNGGTPVFLPTREEEGFCPMPHDLRKLINSRTKCILINSPNNPTGAVYPASVLREIAEIADENGLIIVSDEVYDGFAFGEEFTHISSFYPEMTVTIGSITKNFAMTGWRIGYIIAPAVVISAVKDFLEASTYVAPSPSQRAAIYAVRNHERLIPGIVSIFSERLDYTWKRLSAMPRIHLSRPMGSMYIFPCISGLGLSSVDFCYEFMRRKSVVTLPGNIFGADGEGYIRIAATVDFPQLKVALDRLEEFTTE